MAKEVKTKIKLQIMGGSANPAPPVGSALGQHGVNIMDFCKAFNAKTSDKKGQTVPVLITVYKDRSFDFVTKTTPASELIKQTANVKKGSSNPGKDIVGSITMAAIEEIANIKMVDLNAHNIENAKKIVAGSARSMGLTVTE